MTGESIRHPSAGALQAFSRGKLNEVKMEHVLCHLDTCQECRHVVISQAGVGFLERLRAARRARGAAAPTESLSGLARSLYATNAGPAEASPLPGVPAELVSNTQYQVQVELGRGGMGVVYLAKNVLMDRLEVLKVVNKDLLTQPGAAERFLREIRTAAKLCHDHVVLAYNALALGDLLVFAMEYVEGQDLAQVIKHHGQLPISDACLYVQQAALGLQHAHEHGTVHRDIKPHNLLLSRRGGKPVVKVLDFGLAKAVRESGTTTELTGAGQILGTPAYMAPEQTVDSARADIRADVYSLGCTLYHLLAGRPPFSGKSLYELLEAQMSQQARSLTEVRAEVPAALAAVVAKVLAKDPAQRYQQPGEVAAALDPFVQRPAGSALTTTLLEGTQDRQPEQPRTEERKSASVDTLSDKSTKLAPRRKKKEASKPVGRDRATAVSLWPMLGGGALLLGMCFLIALWTAGVFRMNRPAGSSLEIHVNESYADVFIDGQWVAGRWDSSGTQVIIDVRPGKRKMEVKKTGFAHQRRQIEVKEDQRQVIHVTLAALSTNLAPLVQPSTPNTQPPQANANAKPPTVLTNDKPLPPIPAAPTTGKSNGKETAAVAAVAPTKADGIDLLRLIDLKLDTIKGAWSIFQGALITPADGYGSLRVDYEPPQEYLIDVVLEPIDKVGGFSVQVPFGNRLTWVYAGADNNTTCGLGGIDGKDYKNNETTRMGPVLKVNQPNTLRYTILKDRIKLETNGTVLINWKGTPSRLHGPGSSLILEKSALYLQSWSSQRIAKMVLLPIDERGYAGGIKVMAFEPLFNGRDMAGWKTHLAHPGNWQVAKGILTGLGVSANAKGPTQEGGAGYLYSERGDYQDFHLNLTTRISKNGNGGVFFRAQFGPAVPPKGLSAPFGYEAEIRPTGEGTRTRSLLGKNGPMVILTESSVQAGQWFTMEIVAMDNRILIKIDGRTAVDQSDSNRSFQRGHIALQCGVRTVVEFKKIELKDLSR